MRSLILAALTTSLAVAPAAPVAAARLSPEAQFAKLTAGLTPDKPVDCFNLRPTTESRTLKGLIAYRDGKNWYVNRFRGECPQLDGNSLVVFRSVSSQVCRGDSIDVRDQASGIPRGFCIFDTFTPYKPQQ